MAGRWTPLVIAALASTATAQPGSDHAALRDVLAEAKVIVRGSVRESTGSDTQFEVNEVMRGAKTAEIITVRLLAGDVPLDLDTELIVLLDPETADRVYPLHHPAGRYRVTDQDDVIVNASGVDGATLNPKDLRPRAPDERISLEAFRTLTDVAPQPAAALAPPTAPPPPSTAPVPGPPPAPATPTAPAATLWPWILAAAIAILAGLLYMSRRAR
jgi:hypothetical protein